MSKCALCDDKRESKDFCKYHCDEWVSNNLYEDEEIQQYVFDYKNGTLRNPEEKQNKDMVNHPSHYTFGKYEVIKVLDDWFPTTPHLWNAGKYIARAMHKGDEIRDLEKAIVFIKRRLSFLKGENE